MQELKAVRCSQVFIFQWPATSQKTGGRHQKSSLSGASNCCLIFSVCKSDFVPASQLIYLEKDGLLTASLHPVGISQSHPEGGVRLAMC